jgi:hypothetical protein
MAGLLGRIWWRRRRSVVAKQLGSRDLDDRSPRIDANASKLETFEAPIARRET